MKRTIALALLGVVTATTAFGQGQLGVGNYVGDYTGQITWAEGGAPVTAADNLQFQIFFGAGTIADQNLLQPGNIVLIDDAKPYLGGGYYATTVQLLPSIETYTFQLRTVANGTIDELSSRSVLWQETAPPINGDTLPPNLAANSVGLSVVVPEPTTFALAGLGAAALLIFRRRD